MTPVTTLAATVALGVLLAGPALAAERAPAETFAVVIGWNGGNAELPPLRFADDDAVRFALFFAGLGTPAVAGRVWLLTETDEPTTASLRRAGLAVRPDAPPTRKAVRAALAQAAAALSARPAGRPAILYVVYAGHGLRGRVLLKPTHGAEAALTGAELRAAVAEAVAGQPGVRVFVFLDACRSESLFAERGNDRGADFGAAIADLERRARTTPIGVLTAARNGRPAGEVRRLEAGYFSHVLTSGLAGAADADGDEVVSFGELAAFVAFHTQKVTGQMPWFDPPGGDLGAAAIDHRGRRARLIIPLDAAGRFLVGAGAGLPVFAEAFKDRGRLVRLALPPGQYRVRQEAAGRGFEAAVTVDARAVVDLAGAQWQELDGTRGAGTATAATGAADDGLSFSAAFSPDVVSTLAAGYHAGRAPTIAADQTLAHLELGAGPAPLSLAGWEPRLGLRLRHNFGAFAVAGLARAAISRHVAREAYTLHRYAVGLEAGYLLPVGRWSVLELFAAGGAGPVLRLASSGTSGDPFSPFAEAGLRASFPLGGAWSLSTAGRASASWVRVGDRRARSLTGVFDLGVGVSLP